MARVLVLGAGSWGTVCANFLSRQNHVVLWGRDEKKMAQMGKTGVNSHCFPEVALSEGLNYSHDLAMVCGQSQSWDFIILAVPAQSFYGFLRQLTPYGLKQVPIVNLAKGIDVKRGQFLSEIFYEAFPDLRDYYYVLSGPNLAEEILDGLPASAVLAGKDAEVTQDYSKLISQPLFRVYSSTDRRGVEIAGALKNIFAIAAGICEGLNLGSNARAALLTRGLAEMMRFGIFFGGLKETFFGLSGVGDMMATCFSPLSRNFQTGLGLASGRGIDDIKKRVKTVAEGVPTTRITYDISLKNDIYMPITKAVYRVLFQGADPLSCVGDLMQLETKLEHDCGV